MPKITAAAPEPYAEAPPSGPSNAHHPHPHPPSHPVHHQHHSSGLAHPSHPSTSGSYASASSAAHHANHNAQQPSINPSSASNSSGGPSVGGSGSVGSGGVASLGAGAGAGAGAGKRQTPVKRACDQCHFRRVKCDGQMPCNNCPRLSVQCTYDKPRLRGTSGKRINALRADQSQQAQHQQQSPQHGHAQQQQHHASQHQQQQAPQRSSPPGGGVYAPPPNQTGLNPSLTPPNTYPPLSNNTQITPPLPINPIPGSAWQFAPLPVAMGSSSTGGYTNPNHVDQGQQAQDSSFASFLESSFSTLPPEVSASYRLPNVDTYIPDTFFDTKPFPLSSTAAPSSASGSNPSSVPSGPAIPSAVGAEASMAAAGAMWGVGGFGGLGFLHPSPPSWGGSEGSPQQQMLMSFPQVATTGTTPSSSLSVSSAPGHLPQPGQMQQLPLPISTQPSPLSDSILIPHIALFFERLHPIMPIFTRSWLFSRLDRSEHHQDPQFASMLLAMSALALTQPVQASEAASLGPEKRAQARQLLEESCRMRASALFGQHASIDTVLTSFYIFACLFGMKEDNAAWFRLTEAVTLGQLMRLHVVGSYEGLEKGERERRLRTYWILCITERAYALQRGHPITFRGRPSQDMGAISSALAVGELDDFPVRHLKLFDAVDEDFIDCWNGRCQGRACRSLDSARAIALYKQLSEPLEGLDSPSLAENQHFEAFSGLTSTWKRGEIQSADVLITQQWLLNRLWRLCMSHGLIVLDRPAAEVEPALRVDQPLRIAHAALGVCRKLSMPAIEAHGIGYLEKLYDIATTLVLLSQYAPEVVNQHHQQQQQERQGEDDGLGVSELLGEYVGLFRRFRGGDHPFMAKLVEAVGQLLPQ